MSANYISDEDLNYREDYDYEVDSGAADAIPMEVSSLKRNGFVLIKNKPCKIVELKISKVGKHGHSKVHLVGLDIFTGKKHEDIFPSSRRPLVPQVTKKEYTLVEISDDGYATLLDPVSKRRRNDLKLPEGELGKKMEEKLDAEENVLVTVLSSMGTEAIVSFLIK